MPTVTDLTADTITEAVIAQMADTPSPRLRIVMESLVRHLHDFARDVRLTPEEWLAAIGFLTRTGHTCTPARQEFILLSDTLGLSALVNLMHDATAAEPATDSSLLGPFYREDTPRISLGESIAVHAEGPELVMFGRVRDHAGAPIGGANVQIWQTDSDGNYDLQVNDGANVDLRGQLTTDPDGGVFFRTLRPCSYSIPMDGPVGEMVRAQGRHGHRPAHIHFVVSAPGYRELVTALYLGDDPYIASDTVFGVSRALVISPADFDPRTPIRGLPSVNYEFVLSRAGEEGEGRVGADPSRLMAATG